MTSKIFNKYTVGTLILVLTFLIVSPIIVKNKVVNLLQDEMAEDGKYSFVYDELNISLLKKFPKVSLDAKSFALSSGDDSLMAVEQVNAELSLSKVLGNELEFKYIHFVKPYLKYDLPSAPEKVNIEDYNDVMVQPNLHQSDVVEDDDESDFLSIDVLKIEELKISNGTVLLLGDDSLYLTFNGIDYTMSGQLSKEIIALDLDFKVDSFSYETSGFSMNNIPLSWNSILNYNIENEYISFGENELKIGAVNTQFSGSIKADDHPVFDLKFAANDAKVMDVLTLINPKLAEERLAADGLVALEGYVKGTYRGANLWPAFEVDFLMKDAWFKYHELSQKVEDINVSAKISHSEGTSVDATVISVDSMSLQAGKNYLKSNMKITSPITDVAVRGEVEGDLDLASLQKSIPISQGNLQGKITADVAFDGKLSDIENENYEAFDAEGFLSLRNYFMKNKALPQGISVASADLDFTPERINIKHFRGKLGTSDMSLSGYLANYFAYFFDNKDLKGVLNVSSNYINMNEFATSYTPANTAKSASAASSSAATSSNAKSSEVFMVPQQLNLTLNTNVNKVKADDVILTYCRGKLVMRDSRLDLTNFSFNTLGGNVNVNGQYNSQNTKAVFSDLNLNIKNIEIAQAVQSISLFKNMLPPTQITQGKLSSEMSYYAAFGSDGEVDLNSVKSVGYLSSPGIRIANNSGLNTLAAHLKVARYKDVTTSPVRIDYTMKSGQLALSPFDVKVVDRNINASGWYNINNTLNFSIKTTIKASEIGAEISKYVAMVSDPNKPLPVTVIFSGDASKPDIKYDTREAIKILREDVTKNLNGDAVRSILKGLFN